MGKLVCRLKLREKVAYILEIHDLGNYMKVPMTQPQHMTPVLTITVLGLTASNVPTTGVHKCYRGSGKRSTHIRSIILVYYTCPERKSFPRFCFSFYITISVIYAE